jgi:hypothetical protein
MLNDAFAFYLSRPHCQLKCSFFSRASAKPIKMPVTAPLSRPSLIIAREEDGDEPHKCAKNEWLTWFGWQPLVLTYSTYIWLAKLRLRSAVSVRLPDS